MFFAKKRYLTTGPYHEVNTFRTAYEIRLLGTLAVNRVVLEMGAAEFANPSSFTLKYNRPLKLPLDTRTQMTGFSLWEKGVLSSISQASI